MSALAPACLPLAGVEFADGAVGVALLLFAAWGALRGGVRQILAVCVLVGGVFAAPLLGQLIESTLTKTVRLAPDEAQAAAWGVGLFAAWVVGAVLVSVLGTLFAPALPAARGLGALLGIVQGALLLLLAGQVFLGMTADSAPRALPALSQSHEAASARADSPWLDRARRSLSAEAVARGGRAVDRIVAFPPWIQAWVARVDVCVEEAHARRPRVP